MKSIRLIPLILCFALLFNLTSCAGSREAFTPGDYTYKLLDDNTAELTGCTSELSGDVTLPSSLDKHKIVAIAAEAFSENNSITSIKIPDGVSSIGDKAFWCNFKLTNVTLSDSVSSIGSEAFSGCSELNSINMPLSLKEIGEGAFENCNKITDLVLPNSLEKIGDGAFSITGITSIELPNSITAMGQNVFWGCTNLKSLIIPKSVQTSEFLLTGCDNLLTLTIPKSITSLSIMQCPKLTYIYYEGTQEDWSKVEYNYLLGATVSPKILYEQY